MKLESLTSATTDLTLFFGAESFIARCTGEEVFDPDGEQCLAVLIDLIVNCSSFAITLPGEKGHTRSKLLQLLSDYTVQLPHGMLALRSEIENAIAEQFIEFARARGWAWLSKWTTFQLTSPIVTEGHALRLGGTILSAEGVEAWKQVSGRFTARLKWPPIVIVELPSFVHGHLAGLKLDEFPLCYAFDVYRRGWQYAERVRHLNNDSAYVPHSLRGNCLQNTAAWTAIEVQQETLWSWGKYICAVLRDDELPALRTAEAVVDMVKRIKLVMAQPHGCPTWDLSRAIGAEGGVAESTHLKEIQEWVKWSAREAGLPLLRLPHRAAEATSKLAGVSLDNVLDIVEQTVGSAIGLPITLAKIAASILAPQQVALLDTQIEKRGRQLQSLLFRASLGYGPLVPAPQSARA